MSAYTDAVDRGLGELSAVSPGLCPTCKTCRSAFDYGHGDDDVAQFLDDIERGAINDEGGFSWSTCNACGSVLAGNRYAAHGFGADDALLHLCVCGDCVVYLANGDEPEHWEG